MNKPLFWLALGGGALVGVILFERKARAAPLLPPPEPTHYGETQQVSLAVPAGWRRVTNAEVTPELIARANALRSTPGFTSMTYGTLNQFTASDGNTYATWVEQHYHEPGGPTKPWGLHHGVTLLTASG